MLPKYHIIAGGVLAAVLFLFFGVNLTRAAAIFIGSFIIDIDHLFYYYYYTKKSMNLRAAHRWFILQQEEFRKMNEQEKKRYKKPIFIFHGIEFWSLLILCSFFIPLFWWLLIGIAIHLLMDYIEIFYVHDPLYMKLSLIAVVIKNRNKPGWNSKDLK